MPKKFVSKNQAKAFHAAAAGKSTIGIPKKVAQAAVKENAGKPIKELPTKVSSKKGSY